MNIINKNMKLLINNYYFIKFDNFPIWPIKVYYNFYSQVLPFNNSNKLEKNAIILDFINLDEKYYLVFINRIKINSEKIPNTIEIYDFNEKYKEFINNPPLLLKDKFLY